MQMKHLIKKYFIVITSFFIVLTFSAVLKVYATPPGTPYTPGETLNPTCGPTDTNCTVSVGSSGWGLTGNAGTVDGTNFIGTTDNIPLSFKVNNQKAGRIESTSGNNVSLGYLSFQQNLSGIGNVAIGNNSLSVSAHGNQNVAIGTNSLIANTSGTANTSIGSFSLTNNLMGGDNVALGDSTLFSNSMGANNIAIGFAAGYYETGDNNLFIDNQPRASEVDGRLKSLIYGKFDADPANQFVRINGALQILEGGTSPQYHTIFQGGDQTADITYTLPIAQVGASTVLTNDGTGALSWTTGGGGGWGLTGSAGTIDGTNFIGTTDNIPLTFKVNNQLAGRIDDTAHNAFLGYQAGLNTLGYDNVAIGHQALMNNIIGDWNTAIGSEALTNNTGVSNTANGYQALQSNINGSQNTGIGYRVLYSNTGDYNTATGSNALGANQGSGNTAYGTGALISNFMGSSNVALGTYAGADETGSNNLYIDNQVRGSEIDGRIKSLIYGKFDADPANQQLFFNAQKINMKYLPTSAAGLSSGDLWNNAGVVNIIP